jgi:hypothetical protein
MLKTKRRSRFYPIRKREASMDQCRRQQIPGLGDGFDCARFIGLNQKFSNKQENDIIYTVSVYHPHDQLNPLLVEQFYDKLDERILQRAKASNDTSIIIGANTNSHLGTRESKDDNKILECFGLPKRGNNANKHDLKRICGIYLEHAVHR